MTRRQTGQSYRAYLLRWWREGVISPDQTSIWRFSLDEVGQRTPRHGFASLDALIAFLRAEVNDANDGPREDRSGESG